MSNPSIILKDGSEIPEVLWMPLFLLYVRFMISKVKIILKQIHFILLSQKCMVRGSGFYKHFI